MGPREHGTATEISLVALGLGVLALATPLRLLWAHEGAGWTAPFLVWIALIGVAALTSRLARREVD